MNEQDQDVELLKRFVRRSDQAAFSSLVRNHLDLVYGTALRKAGDSSAAQEIAQNVFGALARKAWQFSADDSLRGFIARRCSKQNIGSEANSGAAAANKPPPNWAPL